MWEKEMEFLETWVTKAEIGGVLVAPPIRSALEKNEVG
jgi:hypothetical protein